MTKNIDDMISQMSLMQKVSQLRNKSRQIRKLGINEYDWWNEALHGVGRAGLATVFPQAIAMAATFDDDLICQVGDIVSTEARAKYNKAQKEKDFGRYKGLTFWSPNINIYRDPRWGRGQETYGEDPYLTSRMGVAYICGLQGSDKNYLKVAACAKHFAVHSGPERDRHYQNTEPTKRELFDSYLPAFEAAVKEGHVESVMSAYNALYGVPCSCNEYLLQQVLREKWGFKGHVVSDCGAIKDIYSTHKSERNPFKAIANALNAGCDLECGANYSLLDIAVKLKYTNVKTIDKSVRRLLSTREKLGMFDPDCPYDKIGEENIAGKENEAFAISVAEKSLVLLENDGVLPIKSKQKIAVIGCNAKSKKMLLGNYEGMPSSFVTVYDGINTFLPSSPADFAEGCHITDLELSEKLIEEAKITAQKNDIIILCLGFDATLEGEEGDADGYDESGNCFRGDRSTLSLPKSQLALLEEILKLGKKTILLNFSGGAVTFGGNEKKLNALVQCWYPGAKGGLAVANVLFGKVSPSGKLPITFYKNDSDLPSFENYSMENRTYRYFKGKALYPFGYGLQYNAIEYTNITVETKNDGAINIGMQLTNKEWSLQDEIIQVYVALKNADVTVPIKALKYFKRISLQPNKSEIFNFTVPNVLTYIDDDGEAKTHCKDYVLYLNDKIIN